MVKNAVSGSADLYARIRAAWDEDAAEYDQRPGHGMLSDLERRAWTSVLARMLAAVQPNDSLRILDVGTGTGTLALVLAAMGHRVTGVDFSEAMLNHARDKAQRAKLSIDFVLANAARLPLEDNAVDVIFSRHVFWTLPQPIRTVREWRRCVRPGGIVAIADGWWGEPSAAMRRRRAVGTCIRRILGQPHREHVGYAELRGKLPVADGVSPYSIRYYLDQAGLDRLKVTDLGTIRAAERRSVPPWYWVDRARYTWLATGHKPV